MNEYTVEAAKIRYAKLFSNKAVLDVSGWVEPNNAIPTDENAFVKRAMNNIDVFFGMYDKVIAEMNKEEFLGEKY